MFNNDSPEQALKICHLATGLSALLRSTGFSAWPLFSERDLWGNVSPPLVSSWAFLSNGILCLQMGWHFLSRRYSHTGPTSGVSYGRGFQMNRTGDSFSQLPSCVSAHSASSSKLQKGSASPEMNSVLRRVDSLCFSLVGRLPDLGITLCTHFLDSIPFHFISNIHSVSHAVWPEETTQN